MDDIRKNELEKALRIMGLMVRKDNPTSKFFTIMTLRKPHRIVLLHYNTSNSVLYAHEEYIHAMSLDDIWYAVCGKYAADSFVYEVKSTIMRRTKRKRIVVPNFMHGCYSVEEGLIQRDLNGYAK